MLTRRKPDSAEETDINYGRRVANALAGFDVGQSVAICERACVALEAMEGTDAMLRRAAGLVNGRRLTLVKVARGREHMLFDVPVIGLSTVPVMRETGTTALAIEAGKTLMLDKDELLAAADEAGIAIVGLEMNPIRTAVVGAGQFGQNHCRVVHESPRAQLAFVVDVDAARAAEIAAKYGVPMLTDFRELAGKVDAAIVATPTTVHEEVGSALLDAGIDVLVEKPIAPDLASATRLIDAAGRHGRILQVGHLERFNPGGHRTGAPRYLAPVFRDPPAERVQPAQPGCGRGARPDDP